MMNSSKKPGNCHLVFFDAQFFPFPFQTVERLSDENRPHHFQRFRRLPCSKPHLSVNTL